MSILEKLSKLREVKLKVVKRWRLNPENCRLYMKVYGLPTDELEEKAKKQLNIELTDSIAQGESVV